MIPELNAPIFLLSVGLILHELIYFADQGVSHFTDDLAPVFGLHLKPSMRMAAHLILCSAALSMNFPDVRAAAAPVTLFALSVVILSFPRRLANHLLVAWFMLLAITFIGILRSDECGVRVFFSMLTLLIFFLAGFHKLNRAYLAPRTSAALALVIWYLIQRGFVWGVGAIMRLRWIIVVSAVVAELAVPALVLAPATAIIGILTALTLVFVFGCLGHAHFAVIMMAGLSAMMPAPVQLCSPLSVGVEFSAVFAAMALGNSRAYRARYLMLTNYAAFGACAGHVLVRLITYSRAGSSLHVLADGLPVTGWLLLALFLVNGLAPYLGVKLDATMAMFSNIRPDERTHLIVRRPLKLLMPRYYLRPEPGHHTDLADDARRVFESLFTGPTDEVYSAYYLRESVRLLSAANRSPVALTASDVGTGAPVEFSGGPAAGGAPWPERTAFFPCRMPLDQPYCA